MNDATIHTIDRWRYVRWFLQFVVLTALVVPRLMAWSSAGGLWRDEVHSVNIASMPADDLFFVLTNDSIPMCWQLLLRGWIMLFGSTDASVRTLGALIGLSIIPAMWWSARQFGISFPWWLMVLMGLDPNLIIFGGEVRGYGLGIVSFLILIGVSWNALQQPSTGRWIALILAALFAVQSSFTNCFLLAATFIACGIVAIRRRDLRTCIGFGLVGMLAAASMLPYALYVMPRLSAAVHAIHDPVPWKLPLRQFMRAYRWGGLMRGSAMIVFGLVATIGILRQLDFWLKKQPGQTDQERDLALFLPPFFWIGTIGFWGYMYFLGVQTAYWYHIPLMILLAVSCELGMKLWERRSPYYEAATIGTLMTVGVVILFNVTPEIQYRLTSIDIIAGDLSANAKAGDLVVVSPWYAGISFGRYYHGPAPWINLPNVDHIDHHRGYQEQKERVMPLPAPLAIKSELQKIESTLQSGGKVWWVGPFRLLDEDESPLVLSGAPHPMYGWSESMYLMSWQELAISRMQALGVNVSQRPVARPCIINPCENPTVFVVEAQGGVGPKFTALDSSVR